MRGGAVRAEVEPGLEVSAAVARAGLAGKVVCGGGWAGRVLLIMRFWKSLCRLCKCSRGEARLAIPST
jgi:hypothetical protein